MAQETLSDAEPDAASTAASDSVERSGVLGGGNWILDHVKLIDQWPLEESLARVLDQSRHNGGGPYNVLKDLANLGASFPLEAVGLLGEDDLGRWIRRDCTAHGIATDQLRDTSDAATSYTDVMTVRSTGRRTFFHQCGANALLSPEHFDFSKTQARFCYLGYILLLDSLDRLRNDGLPGAATVFERARAAGLTTVLDCVSENSDRFLTHVVPILPLVDVLFVNDFEAEKTTGIPLGSGTRIDRAAVELAGKRLVELGVRQLVFVHFPEAACVFSPSAKPIWQPSVNITPTDVAGTNGAGDAFAAGVLFGLHEGWNLPRALALGACAAAASLRHPSCSEAVVSVNDCLALGERFGFREA